MEEKIRYIQISVENLTDEQFKELYYQLSLKMGVYDSTILIPRTDIINSEIKKAKQDAKKEMFIQICKILNIPEEFIDYNSLCKEDKNPEVKNERRKRL